jgi:hypothetical protein
VVVVVVGGGLVGVVWFHANAPEASTPLDDASKRALRAFLELL